MGLTMYEALLPLLSRDRDPVGRHWPRVNGL
jgi:hypothetical protein